MSAAVDVLEELRQELAAAIDEETFLAQEAAADHVGDG
jgi:hypothetical protein